MINTSKNIVLSLVLASTMAFAASGEDVEYTNVTLDGRLYQHDTYGAQWALDTGSDGLWLVPKNKVESGSTYNAPFKLRNAAAADTLVIGGNEVGTANYVGIGTDTPAANLDVHGTIAGKFTGSDTANNHNLLGLSVNNGGTGNSDVGFSMENIESGFKWTFRTYNPGEGFAASKIGTGGTEFQVDNTGTTTSTTVVKMGGVTVFENGHLVTASSRSLKTDIKPLETQAALDAFHKLQPVSYVYKAHKGEPVVGFIAEDVPELVAMPSRKSFDSAEIVAVLTSVLAETRVELKAAQEKIVELETMKKKVAMMESILTNLALDTSNSKKEKVSLNLK